MSHYNIYFVAKVVSVFFLFFLLLLKPVNAVVPPIIVIVANAAAVLYASKYTKPRVTIPRKSNRWLKS